MDYYDDTENLISSDEYSSDGDEHNDLMDNVVMSQSNLQPREVAAKSAMTSPLTPTMMTMSSLRPTRDAIHIAIARNRSGANLEVQRGAARKLLRRTVSHHGHVYKRRSIKWLNNKARREKYKRFLANVESRPNGKLLAKEVCEGFVPSIFQSKSTDTEISKQGLPVGDIKLVDSKSTLLAEQCKINVTSPSLATNSVTGKDTALVSSISHQKGEKPNESKSYTEVLQDLKSNSNIGDSIRINFSTPLLTSVNASCDRRSSETEDTMKKACCPLTLYGEISKMFPKYNGIVERHLNGHLTISGGSGNSSHDEYIKRLVAELQLLDDILQDKELEWNRLLHLKKVKEEMLSRLIRKRNIVAAKSTTLFNPNTTLTELKGIELRLLDADKRNTEASSLTAQQLIEQRANMKRAELNKEEINSNHVQNILRSNNILGDGSDAYDNFNNNNQTLLNSTHYSINKKYSMAPESNPSESLMDLRQKSILQHLNKRSTPLKALTPPQLASSSSNIHKQHPTGIMFSQLYSTNNNNSTNNSDKKIYRMELDQAPTTLERLLKSQPEKRKFVTGFPTALDSWKYQNEHDGNRANGRYNAIIQQSQRSSGPQQFSNEISVLPVQAAHSAARKMSCQQSKLSKFANTYDPNATSPFSSSSAGPNKNLEREVPICQQCLINESRFVCGGCGQQWYCSRNCQLSAWSKHSEVCGE